MVIVGVTYILQGFRYKTVTGWSDDWPLSREGNEPLGGWICGLGENCRQLEQVLSPSRNVKKGSFTRPEAHYNISKATRVVP
jgi:hypothetical protein